ncbi:unnamed protein product [Hydatigera taeniaeformis]|uniref:Uncharacterized protein n=1 Tax=Hydatigena taeniaeformis TaxID=6205 RepID=A0A0R3WZ16_HYDTA|nr:unnamed protein product [Hydatigera taeniaeformis]
MCADRIPFRVLQAGNDGIDADEVGATEDVRLMIARPTKTTRRRDGTRASGLVSSYTTGLHGRGQRRRSRHPRKVKEESGASDKAPVSQKLERTKEVDDDQVVLLPTPAFVQQASAAKCIGEVDHFECLQSLIFPKLITLSKFKTVLSTFTLACEVNKKVFSCCFGTF